MRADDGLPRAGGHPPPRLFFTVLAIAAIAALLSQQLPSLTSARPSVPGNDGDSWFHIAIQMQLQSRDLFANDPELTTFYLQSRPPFEHLVHRSVLLLSDLLGGRLLLANVIGWWCIELLFLSGCLTLAYAWSRDSLVTALFTVSAVGLSRAVLAWWGITFGAVVPHDIGLMVVPWCAFWYLRSTVRTRWLVFLVLGFAANIYPLQPTYLALMLGLVTLVRDGPIVSAGAGAAFVAGALPLVIARLTHSSPPSDLSAAANVVRAFYPYVYPAGIRAFLRWAVVTPLWVWLGLGLAAPVVSRAAREPVLPLMTVAGILLTIVGLTAGRISDALVLPLLHRASALLYVPAYLWSCVVVAMCWYRFHAFPARVATAVLAAALLVNAYWYSPAVRVLLDGRPLMLRSSYFQLSDWAAYNTQTGSLFLVPYQGRTTYFAFRVLSRRPTFLHYAVGETALTAPATAAVFDTMARDVQQVYDAASTDAAIRAVLSAYHVQYVISDRPGTPIGSLPVVYRNPDFVVYDAR